jgi:hypothetical protein
MEKNETLLILNHRETINLNIFSARDTLTILRAATFLKTYHDENGGFDLYRYDETLCDVVLSFSKYYRIHHAYWIPYELGKPHVNWDDWFLSIGEPPHIPDLPQELIWRNPSYEEAILRQEFYKESPVKFEAAMQKNVEKCEVRHHLNQLNHLKFKIRKRSV